MRDYTGKVDPNLEIPEDSLLDELSELSEVSIAEYNNHVGEDGQLDSSENKFSTVHIQAEDYGGGIALPHFGFRRPSVDYYNSNLMSYNFVVADITGGVNNVFFYDERHKGKGANALCSLLIRYHLRKLKQYPGPGP